MRLTKQQSSIVKRPPTGTLFLEGAAGTGKTTVGIRRMLHLIQSDVPVESILVLVPQKGLALPYRDALRKSRRKAGGQMTFATLGSLAVNLVDLFWPLVAEDAGFDNPLQRPTFLSLETAQYFMTRVVGPVIEQRDYFNSVTVSRSRLYSQIIDNLNKAAMVGFPHDEIGERLKTSILGDVEQQYIYNEAQECASLFRQECLENNLLDFSLQVELFRKHLWPLPQARNYLQSQYRHLIVDNVEEDNPTTHNMLRDWLPECESALLIYDTDAGFRRFLGADPDYAYALKDICDESETLARRYTMSVDMAALHDEMARSMNHVPENGQKGDPRAALLFDDHRFYPQVIDWTADHIASLIHDQGVSPGEIVVLAPFLSDSLRFSLMNRLENRDIPVRSHRPSRALRDEPATIALLTFARLAHPHWGTLPDRFDVAYALKEAIAGLDLVRAQLLTDIVYRKGELSSFEAIKPDVQARITYEYGGRYESLRKWLDATMQDEPAEIDFFFSRLFGEVLSQPGYGFHADFDAANVAANLIDSSRNFRWTVGHLSLEKPIGQEYVEMVQNGVIADLYVRDWALPEREAVLLAPAYTFLMSNRPVDYQFWLNVGGGGWWERLYQPLTHPYVLSRAWTPGQLWTDDDEQRVREESLYRLVTGLIRRCRQQIILGYSVLSEQGYEQRGPLLDVIQRTLRRLAKETDDV